MHQFMMIHHDGFAWSDEERGHFREDFFPPVEMPTVAHKPWVVRNMPIPPGIYKKVCKLIQRKINAGVFEPSNSVSFSMVLCRKEGQHLASYGPIAQTPQCCHNPTFRSTTVY